MAEQIWEGVTLFQTGTEGGHWAMQDEKFIGLPAPNHWHCQRCGRVWDRDRDVEAPKPMFTYVVDGHEHSFDEPHPELPMGREGDLFSQRWNEAHNLDSARCYLDGHKSWEALYPHGIWSYEGLHILEDGDELTIYGTGGGLLWGGTIKLQRHKLFTESASGMWIHADQAGVDRELWASWFMVEHRCRLVRP